jgi:LysM repeat protein
MAMFAEAGPLYTPGTFVKTSDTGESFLIDTLGRAISIPNAGQAALLGLVSPKSVTLSKLTGYSRTASFNRVKVKCGTQTYLAITGVLYPISDDLAEEYPGITATLSSQGCAGLAKSTVQVGTYIQTTDPSKLWMVADGKRTQVTTAQYQGRGAGVLPAVKVGPYFASKIAIASTVSATPAPTNTHVVASGETFSSIATKYGLTVTQLKALNPTVTNINSIRVGQLLIIR